MGRADASPPAGTTAPAPLFHPCPLDSGCRYCMAEDVHARPGFDWSFLDGVYCISLQSRDDRTASAAAQFHRLGLCRRMIFYRPLKHPTRPVMGIWESHRAVAAHALDHAQGTVLILEDDVLFGPRIRPRTVRAIAGCLRGLPADWMIFYLGHMARWAYFVQPRVLRVSATAAHAYVASPRLLEWLRDHPFGTPGIAQVRIAGNGIDSAYARLPGAYAFFPLVATQSGSLSDYRVGRSRTPGRKLRHLFSRSRYRELIISKVLRPNQYLVVALSPISLLFQFARSVIERLVGQATGPAAKQVLR
jgi:glycosyl transferase, family 25